MPTSTYVHVPTLIAYLQLVRPESVLDVGVGNGKIGFLARDLLDVMLGQRYRKRDWRVRIEGIEVFEDYLQDHQRFLYDRIHVGDAYEVIDTLGSYDVILLCDVLEHMERDRALRFLDKCADHCDRSLIVGIPLGEAWTQEAVYGNPYERHRSFWRAADFEPAAREKFRYTFDGIGDYGCFLIDKGDWLHHPAWEEADRRFLEGRCEEAVGILEEALQRHGPNRRSEYQLVDLLLKARRLEEGLERLREIRRRCPDDPVAARMIEALRKVLQEEKRAPRAVPAAPGGGGRVRLSGHQELEGRLSASPQVTKIQGATKAPPRAIRR